MPWLHRFLSVAFIFGTVYTVLIPPFQAPDEVHHFLRANHLARGHWVGVKTSNQRLGGLLPKSLLAISEPFRPLRYHRSQKTHQDTIFKVLKWPIQELDQTFIDFPNVAYYAPTGYLPGAIVCWINKQLGGPPLLSLYACRWVTFLTWLLLIGSALKMMPFQQPTLLLLAMLPASLCFHAGFNPDAITHGLAFLVLAGSLKLAYTPIPLARKHLILVLASLLITWNKVVYAPLILLSWLIPASKWGGRRNYGSIQLFLLGLHAALIWGWYHFTKDLFIPYNEYHPAFREDKQLNPDVDPLAQLAFIRQNPLEFLQILGHSYLETLPWTIKHYIGKFGWEGNYLQTWINDLLFYLIFLVSALGGGPPKRSYAQYAWTLLTAGLAMTLAFSIVIYMQWSPPGHDFIRSLSGRYFIPIFPCFILALGMPWIRLSERYLYWLAWLLVIWANGSMIPLILNRYY